MSPRPQPGSIVTIEPLRSLEEVARVKAAIRNPRDLALFTLGVNTNLRASDLLNLAASQIDWMQSVLCLRESKTGKKRTIPLSPQLIDLLLPLIPEDGSGLLFASEKTGQALSMSAYNHLVKLWCMRANLRGNYGARTLRKTWARMQYEVFKVDIVLISMELQHSSPRDTYRYMGITPPECARIYSNHI